MHAVVQTDLATLQRRLATNPFATWLGVRLVAAGPEGVEFHCDWRDEFLGNVTRGAVHGGILATLVDTVATYTVIAAVGSMAATVDLRTDYHGMARRGAFRISGMPVRIGRTLSTAEARVFDCDNRLVASGRGTFMRLDEPITRP
jgi:uncharacterized protein (TIGR00369 family)